MNIITQKVITMWLFTVAIGFAFNDLYAYGILVLLISDVYLIMMKGETDNGTI